MRRGRFSNAYSKARLRQTVAEVVRSLAKLRRGRTNGKVFFFAQEAGAGNMPKLPKPTRTPKAGQRKHRMKKSNNFMQDVMLREQARLDGKKIAHLSAAMNWLARQLALL